MNAGRVKADRETFSKVNEARAILPIARYTSVMTGSKAYNCVDKCVTTAHRN